MNEKLCPLCHKDNNCQADQTRCWCYNLSVPKELLSYIPAKDRNKACVCKNCIELFRDDLNSFKQLYKKEG